jgi:2-methylcitrate dehydratase PrpD
VVDACLALRRDHALTAASIAGIVISGDQLLLDRGDRTVVNEREARVSIHHCAAVAFLFGEAGLPQFSEQAVHQAEVVALRALTTVRLNADSPKGAATATVRTVDGRVLEATVQRFKGSVEDPLSDQEIEAKVRDLARYGSFRGSVEDIIKAVWQLDQAVTTEPFMRLLRSGE